MKLPIFLDNHSTTPMDPRVLETMLPYFVEKFGNAASRNHAFGWAAEEAVENARKQIAKLIKADPKEIVFTSGATESNNLAIMMANNEIGTINPIKEIGKIAKEKGILFHCDATQGVGKIPVDVQNMGIDLMSFTSHKMYGPKGVGALYVRKKNPRVRIVAQIDGGGHERGMRSGTLPVPLIVGFGKACELCEQEMTKDTARLIAMRDRLEASIMKALEESYLNGHPTNRLPGNLNISFAYVEGESLLMGMKDIALSSGSACTSATLEPSYVLRALGVGTELAHSSIRFGLGRFNTDDEIDYTIKKVVEIVTKLREMSPLYEMAKEGVDLKSVQWAAH